MRFGTVSINQVTYSRPHFFSIEESVGSVGALLCIPNFSRGENHLSAEQVKRSLTIAIHIHIKWMIGSVRQRYIILSATAVFQTYFQHKPFDGIVLIDAMV